MYLGPPTEEELGAYGTQNPKKKRNINLITEETPITMAEQKKKLRTETEDPLEEALEEEEFDLGEEVGRLKSLNDLTRRGSLFSPNYYPRSNYSNYNSRPYGSYNNYGGGNRYGWNNRWRGGWNNRSNYGYRRNYGGSFRGGRGNFGGKRFSSSKKNIFFLRRYVNLGSFTNNIVSREARLGEGSFTVIKSGTIGIRASQIPDWEKYRSLFLNYRASWISVIFYPTVANATNSGVLITAIDHFADSNAEDTEKAFSELESNSTSKIRVLHGLPVKRSWRPSALVNVSLAAGTGSGTVITKTPMYKQWFSTDQPDILFTGERWSWKTEVKIDQLAQKGEDKGILYGSLASPQVIQIEANIIFSFSNPR